MSDEELTTMSSREVGARMRKLREERGIAAADLASRIGVSVEQLAAWENGQGVAPFDTIHAIAQILGTHVNAFVG